MEKKLSLKTINLPTFVSNIIHFKKLVNKILSIPKKGVVTVLLVAFSAFAAQAQNGDDPYNEGGDSTNNYDYYDENIDGNDYNFDDYSGEDKKDDAPKKPEKKPYVRIKMPVDTITELITYEEVVIQDESYYDSLYIRAKRWVHTHWGTPHATKKRDKKDNAELYTDDVLYEKFKAKVTVPLKVRYNKFSTAEYGQLQFTITMRFKDGRYKYTISNLVHILPETSDKKDINYVYMEFYMKSERNVVNYDRYLRAADGSIQNLVKDMRKFMREPIEIDEDEW